jgi:hypothetical protein
MSVVQENFLCLVGQNHVVYFIGVLMVVVLR